MVGVLVFVDQNVAELSLILGCHRWESSEQVNRFTDQVVEVECVIAAKLALIRTVDRGDGSLNRVGGIDVACKLFGIDQLVLGIRDNRRNSTGSKFVQIGSKVFDQSLEDCSTIARIVDGEVRVVPQTFRLSSQDCHAGRVESLEPNAVGLAT